MTSLEQIITEVEGKYSKISGGICSTTEIVDFLAKTESYINLLQGLTYRLAIIYNKCKVSTAKIRALPPDRKNVSKQKDDWKCIISSKKKQIPAAPGLSIWSNIASTITELPDNPIYFIKDSNQFAICINGVLLKGNIGNILDSGTVKTRIKECSCNSELCDNYHPKNKDEVRNFTSDSFVYSTGKLTRRNVNMRTIGSRNTLYSDLQQKGIRNYQLFKDQIMHDILVMLVIENYINS